MLLIAVHAAGSLAPWGRYDRAAGRVMPAVLGDLGLALAAGAAGAACLARAYVMIRFYRKACYRCWSWLLAGLSLLAAAVGNGVWSWYELVDRIEPPQPSAADWCFLGFGPLALAALLAAHGDRISLSARLRLMLDTVLIAGSLFAMAWAVALATQTAGIRSPVRTALVLGYPAFDVVLVSLLCALRWRTPDENGGIGTGVRVGYFLLVACDSIFDLPAVHAGYRSGGLLDTGWFAGYLIIAAAASTGDRRRDFVPAGGLAAVEAGGTGGALRSAGGAASGPARGGGLRIGDRSLFAAARESPRTRVWLGTAMVILPYFAAGMCLAGVLADGLDSDRRMDPVLLVAAAAVVVALVARQAITLWENQRLADELRAAARTLEHHAYHDTLTGLPNRALLHDRLEHALTQRAAEWEPVAVLFVDLDGFKPVNDSFGHGTGDLVLVEAARRLTGILRAGDTVARIGGDEFVVVLGIGTTTDGARRTAERVLAALCQDYAVGTRRHAVGASIGLAFSEPGGSATELMRRADVAMYSAKAAGKGRIHVEPLSPAWAGVVALDTAVLDPEIAPPAQRSGTGVPNGETAPINA